MGLTLRLLRHGDTDWSASRRYCGKFDVSLNAKGRRRIDNLAIHLPDNHIGVWTSPLRRCIETVERLGIEATPVSAIAEFDFGEIEGLTWVDLDHDTQNALINFDNFVAPGGESMKGFTARVDTFVDSLDTGCHLLVTHGGVIRHLLRRVGRKEQVKPGSFVEIELRK